MSNSTPAAVEAVTALGHLYAGAAAHLRGDARGTGLLVEYALDTASLGELLDAGTLTIAELLRDIAADRGARASSLLSILQAARGELLEEPDLYTALLDGVAAYLQGQELLWTADELCDLAACPTETVRCVVTLLAATITWRAADAGADPVQVSGNACLRLADRTAA